MGAASHISALFLGFSLLPPHSCPAHVVILALSRKLHAHRFLALVTPIVIS